MSGQVGTAAERFFRKPNLMALRELALRRTADRVDAAARAQGPAGSPSRAYLARDRLLVAIGPDPQAEQLVRTGKRIADALDAEWTAVYVETPALQRLSDAERDRRVDILRLAESLGAGTVTLDGHDGCHRADGVRAHSRRNARAGRRAEAARLASTVAALDGDGTRQAREGLRRAGGRAAGPGDNRAGQAPPGLVARSAVVTLRLGGRDHRSLHGRCLPDGSDVSETNVAMIYVLGATIAGLRLGRGPGTLTAIASVAAFDFFFVPPRMTFQVSDAQYVITFLVMLAVTLTIGNLMANVRQQNRVAGARERRTALLYAMSRELAGTRGSDNMARVAVRHIAEVFDARRRRAYARLVTGACGIQPAVPSRAHSVARTSRWRSGSFDHGQRAGLGTDTLPAAPAVYLPLRGARGALGVLGGVADEPAARPVARAAAPARDVRRTDRARLGTSRAG